MTIRTAIGTLKCLFGLHAWEPPFILVWGPYIARTRLVSEDGLRSPFPHLTVRKEIDPGQPPGQMRCSRCGAFKIKIWQSVIVNDDWCLNVRKEDIGKNTPTA